MTPGINAAKKAKIPYTLHKYNHDPASESYGTEASEKMGIPGEQVFKTLVVSLDKGALAVGIIPVTAKLNMKQMAKAGGAKKAAMATPSDVVRSTGYVLGGVSPLGQKKRLNTVIDASARNFSTIYVSAGRRGLEIELAPDDLQKLTRATFKEIIDEHAKPWK
ncbi:Cys-tRNA(Pro)/Cys-tRNA(Cys) deacylase [Desulfocicer vacuolatum DSM 3385]|uniref:Cys-tRNA(Pro)/Cys-tRNA(Cys) deacylase n=1 Tax=Desulfocicer vacuolatum DSM 3385 TaxID=1121400 RepID=A0A1W2CJQ1_9BACT|nr:Cys-tRNA(Pro) deacylase [Desulfocicer vacuolatum]SMC85467.1 Cys-tRNA(Pro)/Cys-tRNA(Cys) deacylase [Desulfocicer vacuolatum DSM 3385]